MKCVFSFHEFFFFSGFKTPNVAPPPGFKGSTTKDQLIEKCKQISAPPGYNNKASSSAEETGSEQAAPDTDINNERTIFLSNLPFTIEKSTILEIFSSKCGEIVDIRLPSHQGKLKGFGYVEFKTIQAANKALQVCKQTTDRKM